MGLTETNNIKEDYRKFIWVKLLFILSCIFLIIIISGISVSMGSYSISVLEVFSTIISNIASCGHSGSTGEIVIWTLRLPRIAMGILTGMGLGIAGTAMQGVLRNPLASPTTMGISSAAGLGASLAIIAGVGIGDGKFLLIGNAFIFAMMPAMVIYFLSQFKKSTPEMMILVGIGMLYIFGSVNSLLQYFAAADALKNMVLWLMGDLGRAKWCDISAAFTVLAVCIPLLVWKSWDLNVMGVGDDTAKSLGINVDRNRIFIMMLSSLVTATIICFTGMIGFIGLVSPHICRIIIGGDNRYLIPASGLFGAAFLLLADLIARTIIAPIIIPVGIITACFGGPLFLYLTINRKKEYW
jgi:iron complex transport system permease protein